MNGVDQLAQAAISEIRDGMTVGLGTGRAASRAIEALAARAQRGSLRLRCVATSIASEALARRLGLVVEPMESIERLDLLFDGADEVDDDLRMLKGRGGAMTREKIAARAADRRLYLVQTSKLVERLGATALLPVEVLSYGLASTRRALAELGLPGDLRHDEQGEYRTDNGNPVLDLRLPDVDVVELSRAIDAIAGVVGHGLFIDEADCVLIEDERGAVTRRDRR